jgi:hypothetical protein
MLCNQPSDFWIQLISLQIRPERLLMLAPWNLQEALKEKEDPR